MNWESIRDTLWPGIDTSFWLAVAYWAILVLLAGFELLVPQLLESKRDQRWPTNFGLGFIVMAFVPLSPVSALLVADWARNHHVGLLNMLDDSWWPLAALATFTIQSLVSYVTHFVEHKVPWLWRLHRVHHLDTAIDVSTGVRHHPVEFFVTLAFDIFAVIVFGLMPWALILYGTIDGIFSLLTHANIKYPQRVDHALRLILVTPRIHAIHHSSYQPETDSNYGGLFTVWDRVFGTYNDRRADRPHAIQYGLSEVQDDRAADFWWQLKSPVLNLDGDRPILPARSEPNVS